MPSLNKRKCCAIYDGNVEAVNECGHALCYDCPSRTKKPACPLCRENEMLGKHKEMCRKRDQTYLAPYKRFNCRQKSDRLTFRNCRICTNHTIPE